jgi:hypothetical protein
MIIKSHVEDIYSAFGITFDREEYAAHYAVLRAYETQKAPAIRTGGFVFSDLNAQNAYDGRATDIVVVADDKGVVAIGPWAVAYIRELDGLFAAIEEAA